MSNNNSEQLVAIVYNGTKIMVNRKVAAYLEDCKREAHAQFMKKYRNQSAIQCEEGLYEDLMTIQPTGFEDELIAHMEQERLPELIAKLPEVQRRRLTAYFYDGLTYQEIAAHEGVHHSAVIRSVELALKNLKKNFDGTSQNGF